MAYAIINEQNRVVMWSYFDLGADSVEFDNGGFIDENCRNGLEDFVIRDGRAFYEPTTAKQVQSLKAKLESTDYIAVKIAEGAATREEYAEQLAQRERWREAIRVLEG